VSGDDHDDQAEWQIDGGAMDSDQRKKLHLTFHGRIIDSLGIQMYQSPVAAAAS
jgi:hypothetical protein